MSDRIKRPHSESLPTATAEGIFGFIREPHSLGGSGWAAKMSSLLLLWTSESTLFVPIGA
jgi:hypothetical protein